MTMSFTASVVDKRGRRPITFVGLVGMIIALVLLAFAFFYGSGKNQVPTYLLNPPT